MKLNSKTLTFAWFTFLAAYSIYKYLAGGASQFSIGYSISVLVLVLLTAVLPFYLTKKLAAYLSGGPRIGVVLTVPVLMSALGMYGFFIIFILPQASGLSVLTVLPRVIMPAVVISVLLMLPAIGPLQKLK